MFHCENTVLKLLSDNQTASLPHYFPIILGDKIRFVLDSEQRQCGRCSSWDILFHIEEIQADYETETVRLGVKYPKHQFLGTILAADVIVDLPEFPCPYQRDMRLHFTRNRMSSCGPMRRVIFPGDDEVARKELQLEILANPWSQMDVGVI